MSKEVAWRWIDGHTRPCIRNISCWLLQCVISGVTESHDGQVTASYDCCGPHHQQRAEVRLRLVLSAARTAALAWRHQPSTLQAGSNGIPCITWNCSTVPDEPLQALKLIVVSTCNRNWSYRDTIWRHVAGTLSLWLVRQFGICYRTVLEIHSWLFTLSGISWKLIFSVNIPCLVHYTYFG